jgi:hypothetical protein
MKQAEAGVERPCERGTDRPPFSGRHRRTLVHVDRTNDISEFLTSRRAKVTPEQAGLPSYEAMDLTADAGLTIVTYSAEPGSRSEEGLHLLASWTAPLQQESRVADEARP